MVPSCCASTTDLVLPAPVAGAPRRGGYGSAPRCRRKRYILYHCRPHQPIGLSDTIGVLSEFTTVSDYRTGAQVCLVIDGCPRERLRAPAPMRYIQIARVAACSPVLSALRFHARLFSGRGVGSGVPAGEAIEIPVLLPAHGLSGVPCAASDNEPVVARARVGVWQPA